MMGDLYDELYWNYILPTPYEYLMYEQFHTTNFSCDLSYYEVNEDGQLYRMDYDADLDQGSFEECSWTGVITFYMTNYGPNREGPRVDTFTARIYDGFVDTDSIEHKDITLSHSFINIGL